jgi:hypothetical protein
MNKLCQAAVVAVVGCGLFVGCSGQPGATTEGSAVEQTTEAVTTGSVSCSSTCSGVAGATAISKTCNSTCSATTTSVTCDGAVSACVANTPPPVCTPDREVACCAYAGGCGCIGTKTCNAQGTGYGPCDGSTPRGTVCR